MPLALGSPPLSFPPRRRTRHAHGTSSGSLAAPKSRCNAVRYPNLGSGSYKATLRRRETNRESRRAWCFPYVKQIGVESFAAVLHEPRFAPSKPDLSGVQEKGRAFGWLANVRRSRRYAVAVSFKAVSPKSMSVVFC
jgi:hypothetical protein